MNDCRHIEDFTLLEDMGLIITFKDGSHTYINPENVGNIIHAAIMIAFGEASEINKIERE